MWSSLGSLRDRVRENAIAATERARAAAHAAQDVLQAAAAEDDPSEVDPRPSDPTHSEDQDDWDAWQQPPDQPADPAQPAFNLETSRSAPLYNPVPPPPPPADEPPPPPPPPTGLAPVMLKPRTARSRSSRYVVTGLATSQSDPISAAAPRPTPVMPAPLRPSQDDVSSEPVPPSSNHGVLPTEPPRDDDIHAIEAPQDDQSSGVMEPPPRDNGSHIVQPPRDDKFLVAEPPRDEEFHAAEASRDEEFHAAEALRDEEFHAPEPPPHKLFISQPPAPEPASAEPSRDDSAPFPDPPRVDNVQFPIPLHVGETIPTEPTAMPPNPVESTVAPDIHPGPTGDEPSVGDAAFASSFDQPQEDFSNWGFGGDEWDVPIDSGADQFPEALQQDASPEQPAVQRTTTVEPAPPVHEAEPSLSVVDAFGDDPSFTTPLTPAPKETESLITAPDTLVASESSREHVSTENPVTDSCSLETATDPLPVVETPPQPTVINDSFSSEPRADDISERPGKVESTEDPFSNPGELCAETPPDSPCTKTIPQESDAAKSEVPSATGDDSNFTTNNDFDAWEPVDTSSAFETPAKTDGNDGFDWFSSAPMAAADEEFPSACDLPAPENISAETNQPAADGQSDSIFENATVRQSTDQGEATHKVLQPKEIEEITAPVLQGFPEAQSSQSETEPSLAKDVTNTTTHDAFDSENWNGHDQPSGGHFPESDPQQNNWHEFNDSVQDAGRPLADDKTEPMVPATRETVIECKELHTQEVAQPPSSTTSDMLASFTWSSNAHIQHKDQPQPNYSQEIALLQEQIKNLTMERDDAISSKTAGDETTTSLQQAVEQLRGDLSYRENELRVLSEENEVLRKEHELVTEEKLVAEKERDAALERGGDGIREARNAIEEMHSSRKSAEMREAAVSQQNEALRGDLERISNERNQMISELNTLKESLSSYQGDARIREDDLNERLHLAQSEAEVAKLEKEKMVESLDLQYEQYKELQEIDQARLSSLMTSEAKVKELELYISSSKVRDDDESERIDAFSRQIEEMAERTRGVIEERNQYYDDKIRLEGEVEATRAHLDSLNRSVQDMERESASLVAERDEARHSCVSLREQLKEESRQVEAIAAERERLVQERTAMAATSTSVSDKERALSEECEQKTRAIVMLQRKMTSAVSKIEKVTMQRGTFQRQRDEAGSRLRAAGAEFAALNEKLQAVCIARDDMQQHVIAMRDERDEVVEKLDELKNVDSQLQAYKESAEAKDQDSAQLRSKLQEAQEEMTKVMEEQSYLQQKCASLSKNLKESEGRFAVVSREKELVETRLEASGEEIKKIQAQLVEAQTEHSTAMKNMKSLEVDLTSTREKLTREIELVKAELSTSEQSQAEVDGKLLEIREELHTYIVAMDGIKSAILSCLRSGKSRLDTLSSDAELRAQWPDVDSLGNVSEGCKEVLELVSKCCDATLNLCSAHSRSLQSSETTSAQYQVLVDRVNTLQMERDDLFRLNDDIARLDSELEESRRHVDLLEGEKSSLQSAYADVEERVRVSLAREGELEERVELLKIEMKEEIERNSQQWSEQKSIADQASERVVSKIMSIWNMLEKSMGADQASSMVSESEYEDGDAMESDRYCVLALRATASIVAEVDRRRSELQDLEQKLHAAESELTRQDERAEIAERERDSTRSSNERLQRNIENAQAAGLEEARKQYESVVNQLEDELQEAKNDVADISDKLKRSEKEAGELRALCSKLTSQVNGRTNELDEAEEKLVYLQDQVTSLEEDLEDAHARLKQNESELGEARRHDVERLSKDVEERSAQLESLEKECVRLREACDAAEKVAKEMESTAETHRKAEHNLQIAIEQLEAAQDTAVEQRTKELEQKVEEAENQCEEAKKGEAAAKVTQQQLSVRDEEIKELRGALGRLSDERVELKLELEKCLSRMNQPDAGGQLVDRRVVRQLLVSYFRVGTVRRRDVLELMSRMLAFSESDNVAVGLKRRALMDRIGSLVQAPEMDDATLPPLGTVSDKWIEFLMKETEEGEEQSGW